MVAAATPAGAQPAWAHQAPGFQSNGAITVKSLVGGAYGGTENPTGAVVRSNQSAVTQPPTVIIQATGSAVAFETTTALYSGNLGGIAGANAKCQAEFGAGWKMVTLGKLTSASTYAALYGWIVAPGSTANSCSGYTSANSFSSGSALQASGGSGNAAIWSNVSANCSTPIPIVCSSS